MAKRVRQHVNPLSQKYQTAIVPPHWNRVYAKPNQPLHLDIGCAKGEFLLQMAQLQPQTNFLGIEIREPLVTQANLQREQLGLTNLYYLFGNVNTSLKRLLESFPERTLHTVSIQFPDPWFKRRHVKRRVVTPELVNTLAKHLVSVGMVFLQSDVEAVAIEMKERFQDPKWQSEKPWLATNPFPVATEREEYTLSLGKPVYRAIFYKANRQLHQFHADI